MKITNIEKVEGCYQVIFNIGDKTPTGLPIIQSFKEKGLKEVVEALEVFYGESVLKKKDVLPINADTLKVERE